jgi:hypothetical protein
MTEETRQRDLGHALEAALSELRGADRYRLAQRKARAGRADPAERPGPLQFDAAGFPLAQRTASSVERVARLLSPP